MIAQKRLLRPKDEEARRTLDEAFGQVDRRPEVWDVLLTGAQVESDGTGSDQEAFRQTYPFSPALVGTLVALSQALQRERTALKVMLQLLVEGRDELEVSDLVPVGDLFDVLVDSDAQAVTDELKHQFETARRIYTTQDAPRAAGHAPAHPGAGRGACRATTCSSPTPGSPRRCCSRRSRPTSRRSPGSPPAAWRRSTTAPSPPGCPARRSRSSCRR